MRQKEKQESLPKTLWQFVGHFTKKQWWGFAVLCVTQLAWSLQESCFPYFIKLIVDGVTSYTGPKENIFSHLAPILVIAGVFVLFLEFSFRLNDFLMCKIYPKFMANIRMAMFNYVQYHSHSFFSENFAGTIASKIARLPEGAQRIVDEFITIFFPITLAILISCALLFRENPIFAFIVLAWFISEIAITFFFAGKCKHYAMLRSHKLTILNGKIVDNIANIMNVRSFARFKFEHEYISGFQGKEKEAYDKSLFYFALMKLCLGAASTIFIIGMVGASLYFYSNGSITIGDVVLVLSYYSLIGLMWYMCMEFVIFYELVGICEEAMSVIKQEYDIVDTQDAQELTITKGLIEFKDVTFTYNRNKNVFENKSISILPKQKVGLVGFSGSGKTTFVNLILRYFDIKNGEICIDGQNISKVTQNSLRNAIAIIPQDSVLFHRTLLENIRYGRLDATDDEVIEAAKQAHAHDFIVKLTEGYHTLVGERGSKLSGGQRQRIAIARAILKQASILILDEATSALDSVTENKIQESLEHLMQNKTVIVIAHRLSTLLNMDRILVFDGGHVVEDGTHDELLRQKGQYAKLWDMQAGGFLPEKQQVNEEL